MKKIKKHSRTGTERGSSIDQMIEKLGGSGGGAKYASGSKRMPKGRAKTRERILREKRLGETHFGFSADKTMAKAKGKKQLAKKQKKADQKANPEKYVGRTKTGSRKDKKDYNKLYGSWLDKADRPYTVKSTPSSAEIKKASKDYY